ncbi:MAG TPA: rod shape-determining protein MreC [Patescibacteria group bacterium]
MKRLASPVRFSLIIAVIIILLIFFHYLAWLRPLENLIVRILSPVQAQTLSVSNYFNSFFKKFSYDANLESENEQLRQELNELRLKHSQLQTALEENKIISRQVEFVESNLPDAKYLTARVIGRDQQNQRVFYINRGEKDGVASAAAVIIEAGFLIGKTLDVFGDYSSFLLLTDNQSQTAAVIQGQSEINKLVTGEHGLSLKIDLIPQYEEVNLRDIIISSGLENYIPKGLVIGQVEEVIENPNELFKSAIVKPLVAPDNISLVTVIIP